MKISRITTQKKNKNRYNIFLDDGQKETYGFSVDEAILVEYQLRKNLELDASMIDTLVQKDTIHKSYTLTINFLSYRMRTRKEIRDYLIKKEVDEAHISKIMEKLETEKLVNDQQFAEMFVRSRINTSSKGPVLIKKELIEKGVSASIAAQAVEAYSFEEQYAKVLKWLDKKMSQKKKESYRKQLQQVQANLIQKGFTQDVIQEAIANMDEEKDGDQEWEAVLYQGEKLWQKHSRKEEGFTLRNKVKEGLYRKGFSMELINRFLDNRTME